MRGISLLMCRRVVALERLEETHDGLSATKHAGLL